MALSGQATEQNRPSVVCQDESWDNEGPHLTFDEQMDGCDLEAVDFSPMMQDGDAGAAGQ
jgi:hypothetical protein